MDLLIDGQALQTPDSRHRGVGRYGRNLLAALAAARPRWKMAVVQNEQLEPIAGNLGGLPVLPLRPPLTPEPSHAEANARYYADWLCAWAPRRILLLNCFEWKAIKPTFVGPRPRPQEELSPGCVGLGLRTRAGVFIRRSAPARRPR